MGCNTSQIDPYPTFQKSLNLALPNVSEDLLYEMINKTSNQIYNVYREDKRTGIYLEKSKCMVNRDGDVIYFCFQGTQLRTTLVEAIQDLIADAKVLKISPFGEENGEVHFGFFHRSGYDFGLGIDSTEYAPEKGSILDLIDNTEATNIVFTGHSLGGSAAQMAFLRYIDIMKRFGGDEKINPITGKLFNKNFYCICYATPICTTKEVHNYIKDYNNRILSFSNDKDPIPEICRDAEDISLLRKIMRNKVDKQLKDITIESINQVETDDINQVINVAEEKKELPEYLNDNADKTLKREYSSNQLNELIQMRKMKDKRVKLLEGRIIHLYEPIGINVIVTDNYYHVFRDYTEFLTAIGRNIPKGKNVFKYHMEDQYLDMMVKLYKKQTPLSSDYFKEE